MIAGLIATLFCGFSRAAVGSSNTQWWSSRGVLYPVAMLIAALALWSLGTLWFLILPLACLPLLPFWFPLGVKWEERLKMAALYGTVPMLLSGLLVWKGYPGYVVMWGLLCCVVGYKYQQLKTVAQRWLLPGS